jgi:hypothetical protein
MESRSARSILVLVLVAGGRVVGKDAGVHEDPRVDMQRRLLAGAVSSTLRLKFSTA